VISVHIIPRPHANVDGALPLGRGPQGFGPEQSKKAAKSA